MKKTEAGFSLIEVAIVVMIALIVTAMSLPAIRRTITGYQLDSSGHAVASMLQQTRSAAVKNNTPYYAQYNSVAGPSVVIAVPALRFTPNFNYNSSVDPTTAVASNIVFPAGAPPAHAQLETAMGVPVGGAVVGNAALPVAFNARGLPCQQGATPWQCAGPVAFEWFMQNTLTGEWEAVTVSPAGRIKAWRMTGNGQWQ
jgi:type II secretory pathway pseudopilin PulG